MSEGVETLVVGAGQSGLALSHALTERGLEHLVVDREPVGGRWRSQRWDSLAFQFPNWSLQLPGHGYDGPAPDGFAHHSQVTALLEDYAAGIKAPVRTGVRVESLRASEAGLRAHTTSGAIDARNVVLATGPFQQPRLPGAARDLPPDVVQVHSSSYRNPDQLPDGAVLVVGSGGSGGQIAEELLEAGRRVYLALSRHRRVPRRRHGRDLLWWLLAMGCMDRAAASLPDGRIPPTLLITGVRGGHDLNLRALQERGAVLLGRMQGLTGTTLRFHDDAAATLAAAEAGFQELVAGIDQYARDHALDLTDGAPDPVVLPEESPPVELDLAAIGSIVWCTGYAYDYDWVELPCFTDGAPIQHRGVSAQPGLYFLGLHWMHTFKSGTLFGIADDATYLADQIAARGR